MLKQSWKHLCAACNCEDNRGGSSRGKNVIENLHAGVVVDGRYRIVECLGTGGMGTVFSAVEFGFSRQVAIKFLHIGLLSSQENLSRFQREAKTLSRLSEPHILACYRCGVWTSAGNPGLQMPYIAMEYLQGKSLRELLSERGHLPADQAMFIVLQVCNAMAVAHEAGVVHRDLKPANIMILNEPHENFVKIVDFGLAKVTVYAGSGIGRWWNLVLTWN